MDIRPAVTAPRSEITPAQKAAVRNLLDKHFDDAAGRYLEGYTDERIAKDLNIPWAFVTQLREAAYGPLKSDPEVDALRKEAASLASKLAHLQADAAALEKALITVNTRLNAVDDRLRGA